MALRRVLSFKPQRSVASLKESNPSNGLFIKISPFGNWESDRRREERILSSPERTDLQSPRPECLGWPEQQAECEVFWLSFSSWMWYNKSPKRGREFPPAWTYFFLRFFFPLSWRAVRIKTRISSKSFVISNRLFICSSTVFTSFHWLYYITISWCCQCFLTINRLIMRIFLYFWAGLLLKRPAFFMPFSTFSPEKGER